jgi:hypothetical protein
MEGIDRGIQYARIRTVQVHVLVQYIRIIPVTVQFRLSTRTVPVLHTVRVLVRVLSPAQTTPCTLSPSRPLFVLCFVSILPPTHSEESATQYTTHTTAYYCTSTAT